MRLFFGFFALLLVAISNPTQAQTNIAPPDGSWTHSATGVSFAPTVGEFKRQRITEFEKDNNSVGYSYQNDDGELILTLYVYPVYAGETCDTEYSGAKAALDRYKGLKLITEGAALPPNGMGVKSARIARYFIPATQLSPNSPDFVSDLYLYCSSDKQWLLKYRASWTGNEATFPDVSAFLHQIAWPKKLGGGS